MPIPISTDRISRYDVVTARATPDGEVTTETRSVPETTRTRRECMKCHQWTTYGTSMIGPCTGSDFKGPGWRDPLHDWQEVPWPETDHAPEERGAPMGVVFARRCTTESLLTVLNERGFEAVPATVGPAVQRVVVAAHELDGEDATRWSRAQASFYEATRGLLAKLASTPENVERTPEVVLLWMLRAYEAAAQKAMTEEFTGATYPGAGRDKVVEVDILRCALALSRAGAIVAVEPPQDFMWHMGIDYRSRLAGLRPLDAVPLSGTDECDAFLHRLDGERPLNPPPLEV